MGILSAEQAHEIKVKAAKALDLMAPRVEERPSKRIYIVPKKQEKVFTKIKVYSRDRMVFCKVCLKRVVASEAVEVIGGSEQGHRNFWMCREHM